MENYFDKMNRIYKRLMDDESKFLFGARIDYIFNRDEWDYQNKMLRLNKKFSVVGDKIISDPSHKGIILFGCGRDGLAAKKFLEYNDRKVDLFCDNSTDKIGCEVDNVKVISVEEVVQHYRDYLVIISSRWYSQEMVQQLREMNFPEEHIYIPGPPIPYLHGGTGNQYFDVFEKNENEIFVDGGGYNGLTARSFVNWAGGEYKKIYIFEPLAEMRGEIEKNLQGIDNVLYFDKGLWNCEEELRFVEDKTSSTIYNGGGTVIKTISLDSAVLPEDKITFIKLDIEGAELQALQGSANIIRRDRPKMAISIYHKPMDVIDLADYILSLVPDYQFYIRHYTSTIYETILYAV